MRWAKEPEFRLYFILVPEMMNICSVLGSCTEFHCTNPGRVPCFFGSATGGVAVERVCPLVAPLLKYGHSRRAARVFAPCQCLTSCCGCVLPLIIAAVCCAGYTSGGSYAMFEAITALQQLRAPQALWHSVWPGTTVVKKHLGSKSDSASDPSVFDGHNAKAIMESWSGAGPATSGGGHGSKGAGMFGNSVCPECCSQCAVLVTIRVFLRGPRVLALTVLVLCCAQLIFDGYPVTGGQVCVGSNGQCDGSG